MNKETINKAIELDSRIKRLTNALSKLNYLKDKTKGVHNRNLGIMSVIRIDDHLYMNDEIDVDTMEIMLNTSITNVVDKINKLNKELEEL